jgi:hypothetical protein
MELPEDLLEALKLPPAEIPARLKRELAIRLYIGRYRRPESNRNESAAAITGGAFWYTFEGIKGGDPG